MMALYHHSLHTADSTQSSGAYSLSLHTLRIDAAFHDFRYEKRMQQKQRCSWLGMFKMIIGRVPWCSVFIL